MNMHVFPGSFIARSLPPPAKHLATVLAFTQPQGGMFLWLDVKDCVEATQRLWSRAGVRVMAGKFMSAKDPDGHFPGEGFIRAALVPDLETTTAALERMADVLDDMV